MRFVAGSIAVSHVRIALVVGATALPGCYGGDEAPRPAGAEPPSIVLILADDLRADMLGFSGHPFIETPNIDRIAREGAVFANAFAPTPLCSPSRASFLTGLYPHQHGVAHNHDEIDYERVEILPQLLQRRGYRTAFVGKWHMQTAGRRADLETALHASRPRPGFDHWVAFLYNQGSYFDSALNVNGSQGLAPGYSTDELCELGVRWLRDTQGPSFLMLSLKSPHLPLKPPPRHAGRYASVPISLPESFRDPIERLPALLRERPKLFVPKFFMAEQGHTGDPEKAARVIREYARMIPSIDDCVGRVDGTLRELGIAERSVLVLASDNGMQLGEHGTFGKGLAYEQSIRIPLLIRAPFVRAGRARVLPMALNVDVPLTLLELAGAPAPQGSRGRSLVPWLRGEQPPWRDDWLFVGAYEKGGVPSVLGVRSDRWKYVRYAEETLEEHLFDLEADPGERENLGGRPDRRPELLDAGRRLVGLLREHETPASWSMADEQAP